MKQEWWHAMRRLYRAPGFAIATISTLGIAIGASASVFGVVDGVLLKALPYRDVDRVLVLWASSPKRDIPQMPVSAADFVDWRSQNRAFQVLAATRGHRVSIAGKSEAERVVALEVTPDYFSALGITPILGRPLAPDSAAGREVVISNSYWTRSLGRDRGVIGRTLLVDEQPLTIVGVMPAGVPGAADLWTRLSLVAADLSDRDWHSLTVYGRLAPGVSRAVADASMASIAQGLARTYPQTDENWTIRTVPVLDQIVGQVRPALIMLLAASACVVLIACANVANLFLVRSLARQREFAVRAALGASRGRAMRELFVEASILAVAAGALALVLATLGVSVLRSFAPATLPRLAEVGMDLRVVAFAGAMAAVTVLVFGTIPAWRVARRDLAATLKEGGKGTGSAQRHRLERGFVVVQVAIGLALLTGAGLLIESFERLRGMDPGFTPSGVLTGQIALPHAKYATPEQQTAFITQVLDRLAATPGVQGASVADALPIAGGTAMYHFGVVGAPEPDPTHIPAAYFSTVSPGYFSVLGVRLRRGRTLAVTDDSRSRHVAVIDENAAAKFYPNQDALGQRLTLGGPDTLVVVGIVAPVKQGGLDATDVPGIYIPFAQYPYPDVSIAIRTTGDPSLQVLALKQVMTSLDPSIPVSDVRTMDERVAQSIGAARFATVLASLFAGVSLVVGLVGVYAVLAYIVNQRRRELGVRLALGATRQRLMHQVIRDGLLLTGIGVVSGSIVAWWLTRALDRLLVGVNPHDPRVLLESAAAFGIVAALASAIPAYRATRVDPIEALRPD